MGFKDARNKVLDCLKHGYILHEQRGNIDIKNLLAIGEISLEETAEIIAQANGTSYFSSPHHIVASIDVHIVKTKHKGKDWYIKWYFVDPNSVFISVHH